MDLKRVGNQNINQNSEKTSQKPGFGQGPSFLDTLNGLAGGLSPDLKPAVVSQIGGDLNPTVDVGVKFSNHAVDRMMSRGISFGKADMEKLNEAVTRAAQKGSKDTLVLMNDAALIVSVKNKTVVTVMDKTALKENVFTNIDSTIVM